MKRRAILKMVATAPTVPIISAQSTGARSENEVIRTASSDFFSSLRETENRRAAIVDCANEVCQTETITEDTISAIVEGSESAQTATRRVRLGVRILSDSGITTAIDESMIEAGERRLKDYTRYVPLLGSFNTFQTAACAVNEENPETIKQFLYATAAFGIEVGLWYIGAPYKMAWRGTRFISNRTFLRLAKRGCRSCIAFVMSELHWAIRGTVYNADEVVTENKTEFMIKELNQLDKYADEIGYDMDIETDRQDIKSLVNNTTEQVEDAGSAPIVQEPKGPIERLIPEIDIEIELPNLVENFID